MKKVLFLAAVAGMLLGSTAVAQDSVLWFDVRDNTLPKQPITPDIGAVKLPFTNGQGGEGAINSGVRGNGQVLRLNPKTENNFETSLTPAPFPNWDDNDMSTGDLNLFMDVNDKYAAQDMIASLGIDIDVQGYNPGNPAQAGDRNQLEGFSFEWNPLLFAEANAGTAPGGMDGTSWSGAKAVKVPVIDDAGPTYDTTNGLTVGGPYLVGTLHVEAACRNMDLPGGAGLHPVRSTYAVRLSFNNLLLTRVGLNVASPTDEMVAFGYGDYLSGGGAKLPETPYANGSDANGGHPGGDPEALIIIQMKCDQSGNGRVTGSDLLQGWTAAVQAGAALTQEQAFLWNGNGVPGVTGSDLVRIWTRALQSSQNPCP